MVGIKHPYAVIAIQRDTLPGRIHHQFVVSNERCCQLNIAATSKFDRITKSAVDRVIIDVFHGRLQLAVAAAIADGVG